jgi:hypothetical protein
MGHDMIKAFYGRGAKCVEKLFIYLQDDLGTVKYCMDATRSFIAVVHPFLLLKMLIIFTRYTFF